MFKKRKAQTTVEYILITLVMVVVFVVMHRALQWAVAKRFEQDGVVILKMYKADFSLK
ncbi:MAG: hypothetical protein GX445_06090 [Elusimicrobia bacterium]|jgi:hypothetical protein|nr:hypothetical protein [Elusimicrobiota bacterium]